MAQPYPCPVPVQSLQVIHQLNCRAPCEASISENTNLKQDIQAFFKYKVDKSLQQLWPPMLTML